MPATLAPGQRAGPRVGARPEDARTAAAVARVRAAVRAALAGHERVVLAVSGGRDSVALLAAALDAAPGRVVGVATYDHGSGPGATAAAEYVRRLAAAAGLPVRVGRAGAGAVRRPTEAAWRAARWRFLRRAARRWAGPGGAPAVVATGHTRDDQLETVVMRLLRGAGARGLAAMRAAGRGVVRPLLAVPAADVAVYAASRGLAWVEDPSNGDLGYLRNRVRRELLPALHAVDPDLAAALLAAAGAAGQTRRRLERVAAGLADAARLADGFGGAAVAPCDALASLTPDARAALWPALADGAGVRLDRRGVRRLVTWGDGGMVGAAVVAGPARVAAEWREAPGGAAPLVVVRRGAEASGTWRLRACEDEHPDAADLAAGRVAWLPADRRYAVRAWRPGDRWQAPGAAAARRVKRFLADRRVPAAARPGWPVVVDLDRGGQIVWVPGVRRSPAAPDRPGEPGLFFRCERTHERRADRPPRRR